MTSRTDSSDTLSTTDEGIAQISELTRLKLAPPEFDDPAHARRHCKERLAASFRILARFGLTTGIAGHISARDPARPDHFWVNPLSMPFSQIRVSDLLLVDRRGAVVEGDNVVNAAAFAIHSRIHERNPHLNAACHSHAPWGRPWSATGRLIRPTSQDATAFYNSQVLVGGFEGVVMDECTGNRLGDAFTTSTNSAAGVTVVVHQNHGHITAGETVDEAVFWFLLYEQVVQSQMRLEFSGLEYHVLNDEIAAQSNATTGTRYAGWLGFQTHFAEVAREQPDLFD